MPFGVLKNFPFPRFRKLFSDYLSRIKITAASSATQFTATHNIYIYLFYYIMLYVHYMICVLCIFYCINILLILYYIYRYDMICMYIYIFINMKYIGYIIHTNNKSGFILFITLLRCPGCTSKPSLPKKMVNRSRLMTCHICNPPWTQGV